ncbi:hypothetical protein [Methanolobus bombayensis]|uniref:hypothetical protein n=1 Tax=Methanolobus bombayensis TaxID=38023 RepID=UPI001AE7C864|nr:hypothetical protein [Methanolobus bombayensis]MBP1909360.1 hypothetical protein [Methanolobus bombayensis]
MLVVFSIVMTIIYLESTDKKEETYTSSYNYEITIKANKTLHNATFYLPVPVSENESIVGQQMMSKDFYNNSPEWNFSLVNTQHGTMLELSNKKIVPTYHSLPKPISEDQEVSKKDTINESNEYSEETPVLRPIKFTVGITVKQSIDTKYPLGNESVLIPKYNLRITEPVNMVPPPEYIDPEYYEYESLILAQYNTSELTDVEISIELTGTNEWWTGGWRFDTFQDTVNVRMNGMQNGWISAEGSMITGDGIYDN